MIRTTKFASLLVWSVAVVTIPALEAGRVAIKPKATPTPTHQEILISAVTGSSVTVVEQTLSDKGKILKKTSKTYGVTQFTEITVNGQRATIADLKPAMKVRVTIGTDPTKAARLVANG